jgi:hypothetical protein
VFFPDLISAPFHHGLTIVFAVSAGLAFIAAVASLARGPDQSKAAQPRRAEEPASDSPELVAALWPDED